MQRSHPVIALGWHVGAVLDEEAGHVLMTPLGHLMQRSRPVIALGCHVGAVLDEEPGQIHTTP